VLLYNYLFIPVLFVFFKIAGLFNSKIKQGVADRKNLFEQLAEKSDSIDRNKKLVWVHSASLGEFEQAKPIIEKLKKEYGVNILVSFFSPSGYRNSIKYPHADVITYLPLDSLKNMKKFVDITKPDILILMRYDIWPNLVKYVNEKNIPSFIVDATMRDKSKRKLPLVKQLHKNIYKNFTKILTVSETDLKSFKDFDLPDDKLRAVGDTRFDRVYQKSLLAKGKKLFVDGFFENKKVFVFGSSWESDEDVVIPAFLKILKYDKNAVMIIAPHEPTVLNLEKIEHTLTGKAKFIRFSSLNNYKDENVIIIDSIGILLTLYYYADIAYVGGSFKQGIHNVLEPAVYGPPVMFGPKIENSQEAIYLSKTNGGILIRNKKEMYRNLRYLLSKDGKRKEIGDSAKQYVLNNIGATERILEEIVKYLIK
jgi:3-deoxy-D-manno-octulosonic-acid transferase